MEGEGIEVCFVVFVIFVIRIGVLIYKFFLRLFLLAFSPSNIILGPGLYCVACSTALIPRTNLINPSGLIDDFSRGLGNLTTTLREWAVPTRMVDGKRVIESSYLETIMGEVKTELQEMNTKLGNQSNLSEASLAEQKKENRTNKTQGSQIITGSGPQ